MANSKAAARLGKVKVVRVEVTQNKLLKTVAEVPQWEAQVLLALWGEDARVIEKPRFVERRLPLSVEDEFQRLVDKYGPRDEDTPIVAKVYGSYGPGLRALNREIDISIPGGFGETEPEEPTIAERANAAGIDLPDIDPDDGALTDEQIDALDIAPTVSVRDENGEVKAIEDFSDLANGE